MKSGQLRVWSLTVALVLLAAAAVWAQQEGAEAPFGDKVSDRIPFYHRAAPEVATAGPLGRLGIIEAKSVGFRSILNLGLSTTALGLDDPAMAAYVLVRYFNVPLANELPTQDEVERIRKILEDPANAPVLLYGIDRDQAAAAWALVRVATGVPPEFALQEGLAAGLRGRLAGVRERLGAADRKR
jgi:uncharacterized protein (TIGR01244 family)